MNQIASDLQPFVALPVQEHEGAMAWRLGTLMQDESMPDGLAFCPYEFGTIERQNWLVGYAAQVFRPDVLAAQAA